MLFQKTRTIIIIGASRFGAGLAGLMSEKGFRVIVLDVNEGAFRKLPEDFGGYQIVGDGTDTDTLRQAGIEEADTVIASTDDDNTNILTAQIASRIFQIPHVYTRLNDRNKAKIVEGFNIKPICPYVLSVNEFIRLSDGVYGEVKGS